MSILFGNASVVNRRMGSPGVTFGSRSETFGGGQTVWESIWHRYTNGIKFTDDLADGTIVPNGCPLVYDKKAQTATIHRSFVVNAAVLAAATELQTVVNEIYPRIQVGDVIMIAPTVKGGTGTAVTVTVVDTTTSTEYDLVTISATLGAMDEGTVLTEADSAGATKSVLLEVNTFIDQDVRIGDGDSNTNAGILIAASPVWSGEINKDLIPPYPAYVEDDAVLGQRILFNHRKA